MISELEKQFFAKFEIKPEKGCTAYDKFTEEEADVICNDKCAECSYLDDVYPQITDRILLELIIILGTICTVFDKNVDDLKENVLKNLIELSGRYHIYNQVRTLFEE